MITRRPETAHDVELVGRGHRVARRVPLGEGGHPMRTGVVAALVILAAVAATVAGGMPNGLRITWPWVSQITLHVQLADSRALEPHAAVQVAGVKVGEVVSVVPDGSHALATFVITDPAAANLRSDATVLLRPHGLFGPKYLDIEPGTAAQAMGDGTTITLYHTVEPVDIDSVLQALQAPEQQNLRTALLELGAAAQDRGADVNRLLVSAAQTTRDLQAPLQTLATDSNQLNDLIVKDEAFNEYFAQAPLDQLVANSDISLRAIADNSGHLQSLLVHANSSLGQLAADLNGQTGNLRTTIEKLPGIIDELNTFNANLALFGRNLTGKDTTVANDTSVTNGIIAAIENPKSAFSSYDCTVPQTPCPSADRRYYLRVQVFDLAGSGALPAAPAFNVCNLPILTLPNNPIVNCTTTNPTAYQTPLDNGSSDMAGFAALVGG